MLSIILPSPPSYVYVHLQTTSVLLQLQLPITTTTCAIRSENHQTGKKEEAARLGGVLLPTRHVSFIVSLAVSVSAFEERRRRKRNISQRQNYTRYLEGKEEEKRIYLGKLSCVEPEASS